MRILSSARVAFFEKTGAGSANSQIVPVGSMCDLRCFSATPSGDASQFGVAHVEFINGDSSGNVLVKYRVPFIGSFNFAPPYGTGILNMKAPNNLVSIPGIGVRFTDGMNVKITVDSGSLDTQVQVIYT
jgi:hypothetical protein